jgi:hypothetical protein
VLRPPAGLPDRLAELLAARAGGCDADARAVLSALAVAGRPLTEDMLASIAGLDPDTVRAGLRELAAARLLAASATDEGFRPRHALLAEAVAAGLLPGERVVLHERTARALAAAGDEMLAGDVTRHWAAAGRSVEELLARVAAAGAAERVFGYAEAAVHLQRAIELCQAAPAAADAARAGGVSVPRLYVWAIDALEWSGDSEGAREFAGEAYHQFADHPDPATAAVIHHRVAHFQSIDAPATGLPLIEEALRLFGQAPPQPITPRPGLITVSDSWSMLRGGWRLAAPPLNVRWRWPKRPARRRWSPASCRGWDFMRSFAGGSRRVSPSFTGDGPWPRRRGMALPCCIWI